MTDPNQRRQNTDSNPEKPSKHVNRQDSGGDRIVEKTVNGHKLEAFHSWERGWGDSAIVQLNGRVLQTFRNSNERQREEQATSLVSTLENALRDGSDSVVDE